MGPAAEREEILDQNVIVSNVEGPAERLARRSLAKQRRTDTTSASCRSARRLPSRI